MLSNLKNVESASDQSDMKGLVPGTINAVYLTKPGQQGIFEEIDDTAGDYAADIVDDKEEGGVFSSGTAPHVWARRPDWYLDGEHYGLGASGDSTDKTQGFFNIAARRSKVAILPPNAALRVADVSLPVNLNLIGMGHRNTILRPSPGASSVLKMESGTTDQVIRDIGIDQSGSGAHCIHAQQGSSQALLQGVRLVGDGPDVPLLKSEAQFLGVEQVQTTSNSPTTVSMLFDSWNQGSYIKGARVGGIGRGVKLDDSSGGRKIEGFRIWDLYAVCQGAWQLNLAHVYGLDIFGFQGDQSTAFCTYLGTNADRINFIGGFMGCPGTTETLCAIAPTSGSNFKFENMRFYGGAKAIHAQATAAAGQYLNGLKVEGCELFNQAVLGFDLDSVQGAKLYDIEIFGDPVLGPYATRGTNRAPELATFECKWNPTPPQIVDPNGTYRHY